MPGNPMMVAFGGQGVPKGVPSQATMTSMTGGPSMINIPGNAAMKVMGMPMSMMGMMNPMGGQGFPAGMPIQMTP